MLLNAIMFKFLIFFLVFDRKRDATCCYKDKCTSTHLWRQLGRAGHRYFNTVPRVTIITNTDSQSVTLYILHGRQTPSHTSPQCHKIKRVRMLTFDPVPLIEADFSLSLGRVWSSGDKHSSWDGAVEASPLACGLHGRAGRGRPGGPCETAV